MPRSPKHPGLLPSAVRIALPMLRDAVLTVASFWLALLLRFDASVPSPFVRRLLLLSPVIVTLLLCAGLIRGMYRTIPKYTSVAELLRVGETVGITSLAVLAIAKFARPGEHLIPLSVPIISAPIVLSALGTARIFHRVSAYIRLGRPSPAGADRMLIVGAGDAGEIVARDMLRNPQSNFLPVGFLDDDPAKQGRRIHGVSVLGPTSELEEAVRRTRADYVLIAMPSASSRVVRALLRQVAATGAKVKILPSLRELVGDSVTTEDIRDVDVADVIGRDPVKINPGQIAGYLEDRRVLVTGAAGSIGSELARQLLRFRPARLLLLDHDESGLYCLSEELVRLHAGRDLNRIGILVADIRDRRRIDQIFATDRPHVVFHAAAYKHVPVLEVHPTEAVITNIIGTRHLAEAAVIHGTDRFVFVSTDKAIKPTSVMGATKRVAEFVIEQLAAKSSTVFASVRFGNVLGSRGSVVPIFVKQIRDGGPITVTHPQATRYFMTLEEATALIIQAGALAHGSETFVLNMGEPVRILDLAERMRDLLTDGNRERIEITFTGLRAGEKLHEDLWQSAGELISCSHPRIYRTRPNGVPDSVSEWVGEVEALALVHAAAPLLRKRLLEIASIDADLADSAGRAVVEGHDRMRSSR